MRQQHWIALDNFRRRYAIKAEIKYWIFLILFKNNYTPNFIKYFLFYKKNYKKRWTNDSQAVNRCFISGRHWFTTKFARQARFVFRNSSYAGHLPGFRRASW